MQTESVYQCAIAETPEQYEHLQQEYMHIIIKSNNYQIHLFQQNKIVLWKAKQNRNKNSGVALRATSEWENYQIIVPKTNKKFGHD